MASGSVERLVKSDSDLIKLKTFSASYTLNSGADITLTQTDFGYSVPDGYVAFATLGFNTGSKYVSAVKIYMSTANAVTLRNDSSSKASSVTCSVRMAFIKSDLVSNLS